MSKTSETRKLTPEQQERISQLKQAIKRNNPNEIELITNLVKEVAKEELSDLLYFSIASYNITAIDVLIKAGADVNKINQYGNTALMYLTITTMPFKNSEIINDKIIKMVEKLLKAGADPNILDNIQHSVLIYAIRSDNT